MKKHFKAILVLVSILVIIIIIANWQAVTAAVQGIYLSGSWLYIIVIIILIALALVFVPWGEVWLKLKFAKRFSQNEIPQHERFRIAGDFAEEKWKTITASKGTFTLVSNFITPRRKDAQMWELFTFTTNKAYADKRLKAEEISDDELFNVIVDCHSGDVMTPEDISKTDDLRNWLINHWLKSIDRPQETLIDKMIKKGFAEAIGEKVAEREMEKDKEVKE